MFKKDDILKAVDVLHKGGIILYPTDTIWGLGCDAINDKAVRKIYQIKNREDTKSMLILISEPDELQNYVYTIPEIVWQLIDVSIKPLTIIYPGAKNLPKSLINHDGSIGIRITNDDFCLELLKKFRKPIVSTSANKAGEQSPDNFSKISEDIKESVDYVVRWKQEDVTLRSPSSIIKVGFNNEIEIIRA